MEQNTNVHKAGYYPINKFTRRPLVALDHIQQMIDYFGNPVTKYGQIRNTLEVAHYTLLSSLCIDTSIIGESVEIENILFEDNIGISIKIYGRSNLNLTEESNSLVPFPANLSVNHIHLKNKADSKEAGKKGG